MFARIRGFLYRHRRKFIVTGVVVGGMVLASRYAQKKLREWQEKETREFMERTRRQHHFESTERTCNQMILSLMHTVRESIVKILNTEELVVKLRNGPADKVHIWEELKVLAFTRASVLVYAGAMLVVSLRIQLNLVGGYMFQDTIDEMEEGAKPPQLSSSLQESYLCLCHHFVNDGIRQLCTLMEEKVRLIVEGTSLKQRLNLQDTEQLFWAIQAAMISDARDPVKSLGRYFFPPDRPMSDNEMLQKMVLETEDLLESEEVLSLTASCVSRGFSLVVDKISDYYGPAANKASLNEDPAVASTSSGYANGISSFVHPNAVAMPMAKLIPIVNGLIPHKNGHAGPPDSWIQHLILDEKLKLLGANVYEAFSNK